MSRVPAKAEELIWPAGQSASVTNERPTRCMRPCWVELLCELIGPLALMTKPLKGHRSVPWLASERSMAQTPFSPYLAVPFLLVSMNESSCRLWIRTLWAALASVPSQPSTQSLDYIRQDDRGSLTLTTWFHSQNCPLFIRAIATDTRRLPQVDKSDRLLHYERILRINKFSLRFNIWLNLNFSLGLTSSDLSIL